MKRNSTPVRPTPTVITFAPPIEVKEFLKKEAEERGISLNAFCIQIVKEYMETRLLVRRQKELFGK